MVFRTILEAWQSFSMRTVHILAVAFGVLVVLLLIVGIEALRSVESLYDETSTVHAT